MIDLSEYVDTQYSDARGFLEMDSHDGSFLAFYDIAKNKGEDLSGYFIIGFRLADHSIRGVGLHGLNISLILLDKSRYGNSFDEIEGYIKKNKGVVDVETRTIPMSSADIAQAFKRVEMIVLGGMDKSIEKINFPSSF